MCHARHLSSLARLSSPVLGSVPCVRFSKLSFVEKGVPQHRPHTPCNPHRRTLLTVSKPACTRRCPCICGSHVGHDISFGFVEVSASDEVTHGPSKGCSPGFIAQPRTSSQQFPCQESRFTLHLWRLAQTSAENAHW